MQSNQDSNVSWIKGSEALVNKGRDIINAVDPKISALIAEFSDAACTLEDIKHDFSAFVEERPALSRLIDERVIAAMFVALGKDQEGAKDSYRADRHKLVLEKRISNTVELGGNKDIATAFFTALLDKSVAMQNQYLQNKEGRLAPMASRYKQLGHLNPLPQLHLADNS